MAVTLRALDPQASLEEIEENDLPNYPDHQPPVIQKLTQTRM